MAADERQELVENLLIAEVNRLREVVKERNDQLKSQGFALDAAWSCLRQDRNRSQQAQVAYERICKELGRDAG